MMCAQRQPTVLWALVSTKVRALMDVILHIGAHRTATTTFQHYMRTHMDALNTAKLTFWGPLRTRKGLFDGLGLESGRIGVEKRRARGVGRVQVQLERHHNIGVRHLVVSDENMIGSVRDNLKRQRLYPGIGERVARYVQAFEGHLTRVVLSIRSLESFWASSLAYGVPKGARVPNASGLDRLVTQPRSWRDVITDLSCALPDDVELLIAPFERLAGRPDDMLEYMVQGQLVAPRRDADSWRNKSPELTDLHEALRDRGEPCELLPQDSGVWHAFDRMQAATLREIYADDLFWLRAGADGMALLIEETGAESTGHNPFAGLINRGQYYDQERGLVRTR